MADNLKIDGELKSRLFKAQSAGQVMEIIKKSGQEITAEDADHLFQEISRLKECSEFSDDELEAVSGGVDRDWQNDGCAATVEPDSWCWSDDACAICDVVYENNPKSICPKCGAYMMKVIDGVYAKYTCTKCGNIIFERVKKVR